MGRAADRLGRASQRLRTLPEKMVETGNKQVRARPLDDLRQDAGSDRTLSGVPNARPLRVKTTKRSFSSGSVVVGHVMAGPPKQRAQWFWLEEGTKSGPRRVRRTGRVFVHPGTPAKRTWSRGVSKVLPEVRREWERLYRQAMKG